MSIARLNPVENAQNMLKHTMIPDLLKKEGTVSSGLDLFKTE
jgi:hypothetical protein